MQGRRLPDDAPHFADVLPVIIGRTNTVGGTPIHRTGSWGISKTMIVEREDGTITVSPSILVKEGSLDSWHGYLERDIWRSC